MEGASFKPPTPPPLPQFRLTEDPAFTYTGVDFVGPLYVQENEDISQKIWINLFCYVTRAIHLDAVSIRSTHRNILEVSKEILSQKRCTNKIYIGQ